jgi:uncharacterized YigZ family protein
VVFFLNRLLSKEITTYKTLHSLSEGLYKEKGSKFIAYASPCSNEQEAKELLSEWKKINHQARHLCYAYRFGVGNYIVRANDDGEPSNSAGTPILGQIQSYELTNILIGVIRYFGGTKLGVGGLVQAYKTAAKEAIEAGEIILEELKVTLEISFPYEKMPVLMHLIKTHKIKVLSQQFALHCNITIEFPLNENNLILPLLNDIPLLEITNKL